MKKTIKIKIDWETDGEDVDLPTELEIPKMNEYDIADWLSDKYGWLVSSIGIYNEKTKEYE